MKYSFNPPSLIKRIFNDFIWESSVNKVLLTFDDGPLPETTPIILKTLDKLQIKALFFCVGNNSSKYPGLISEIINKNHYIGFHSSQHQNIKSLPDTEFKFQLSEFKLLLKEKYDYPLKYFRPPYGKFNLRTSKILKEAGFVNVMWSLLTYDYKNDLNLVKFAVDKYLKNDSIVVFHDSLKSKNIIVDSLEILMETMNKNGFEFGDPSECLK